jgi:hypothetical protein
MFDRLHEILNSSKAKFLGYGERPAKSPYGEYYQNPSPFKNYGEQVIFFATSGSSGYMEDGVYRDISGAQIREAEFIQIVSQANLKGLLRPGVLSKMWRGEKVDLATGEDIK